MQNKIVRRIVLFVGVCLYNMGFLASLVGGISISVTLFELNPNIVDISMWNGLLGCVCGFAYIYFTQDIAKKLIELTSPGFLID